MIRRGSFGGFFLFLLFAAAVAACAWGASLLLRRVDGLESRVQSLEASLKHPSQRVQLRRGGTLAERRTDSRGNTFDAVVVDVFSLPLRLYYQDDAGRRLGNAGRLEAYLATHRRRLVFATNAGMYSPSHEPVGLFVHHGRELFPLNLATGAPGNFYLQPNGVFALTSRGALVVDSATYNARQGDGDPVLFATQSGPMLLVNSRKHPAFRPDSINRAIRSGVGLIDDTTVVLAISNGPVTFTELADFFQTHYGCASALYLDGVVSRMFVPALNRRDVDGDFGVMIALTE